MDYPTDGAERYRKFSEELLTIADGERRAHTRSMLIQTAQDYERMAKSVKAIDDSQQAMKDRTS